MRRIDSALARVSVAFLGLSLLSLNGVARGQADGACQPAWVPAFGAFGAGNVINALAVFDDGGGPALYAAGSFGTAGGVLASNIARWDDPGWSALGGGTDGAVSALTVFDDGSGPALYAGGQFTHAGGVAAQHVAKWNGAAWSALGGGVTGGATPAVIALAVFDDGSGPALQVGGLFTTAGAGSAANVASWNGTSWSPLGSGANAIVRSFAVFDDGGGPALYVGGEFTLGGGVPMNRIGTWDGANWSAVGGGVSGGGALGTSIKAIQVFDDGGGPAIFVGGGFTVADGVTAPHIAKWNGTSWSAVGFGFDKQVFTLTVFDDGSGPALYAGGSFAASGGVANHSPAKWNGLAWSALAGGVSGGALPSVNDLAVFDDGSGPALFAGGNFPTSPAGDSVIAEWAGCSAPPAPWTDLGSGLAGVSGVPSLAGTGTLIGGSAASLNLTNARPSAPAALFVALSSIPAPFKGGTLVPVPTLLTLALATSGAGTIPLPFAWPTGLPSGFGIYYQYAVKDSAAVQGVALSNALKSTTP